MWFTVPGRAGPPQEQRLLQGVKGWQDAPRLGEATHPGHIIWSQNYSSLRGNSELFSFLEENNIDVALGQEARLDKMAVEAIGGILPNWDSICGLPVG